jgi:hypothetical protein
MRNPTNRWLYSTLAGDGKIRESFVAFEAVCQQYCDQKPRTEELAQSSNDMRNGMFESQITRGIEA